jgi:hypothetical protein
VQPLSRMYLPPVLKANHEKAFIVVGTRAHAFLHGTCHGR